MCIHTMSPTHCSLWLASRATALISSSVVPVGLSTILRGKFAPSLSWLVMVWA
ncbi:hypothetical protein D3C79_940600 [compost metagenome]